MIATKRENIIYVSKQYAYDANSRPLGEGDFGKVYKGFDVSTKAPVVIKVARKSYDSHNELYAREMMILDKITGENFVQGLGSFETRTHFNLVMEYCDGGSLEQKLTREKKLPEKESLSIVHQIANAFIRLAEEGIKDKCRQKLILIHRDLKPANILFSAGKVKVCDFGLSKLIVDINSDVKFQHTKNGTPLYMSPQVLSKTQKFSTKCDVFSTGVMLYEMLHGVTPWIALKAGSRALYLSRLPTLEYSSAIGKETLALLKGMLEIEEERRFNWSQVYKHPAFLILFPKKAKKTVVPIRGREDAVNKKNALFKPSKTLCTIRQLTPEPSPTNKWLVTPPRVRKKPKIINEQEIDNVIYGNRAKTPCHRDRRGIFFGMDKPPPKNDFVNKDILLKYTPTKERNELRRIQTVINSQDIFNCFPKKYGVKPLASPQKAAKLIYSPSDDLFGPAGIREKPYKNVRILTPDEEPVGDAKPEVRKRTKTFPKIIEVTPGEDLAIETGTTAPQTEKHEARKGSDPKKRIEILAKVRINEPSKPDYLYVHANGKVRIVDDGK